MKAGVVGLINGTVDELDSFTTTYTQDGRELKQRVEIKRKESPETNLSYIYGEAAREELDTVSNVSIKEDSIETQEKKNIDTEKTEFLILPNDFIVIGSSSGTFVFDLIGHYTNTLIQRAEIDLEAFEAEREIDEIWQAGFYNNAGHAEKGTIYGDGVLDDSDIGNVIIDSKTNQLGLVYAYNDDNIKITATRSGYVEIYDPSDYETGQYLQFIDEEISPYTSVQG
jgi:hypothetical protein